jgi:acetyl-CoA decarbonylase/synthase complex subunit epsilon
MATAEPWLKALTPGPTKALVITKPEVVVAMLKRAKRPILVVGHEITTDESYKERLIDSMIHLAKAANIPLVTTAHIVKDFLERGFRPAAWMSAVDIANRLQDSEWKGLDGNGPYDLALFAGLPYYMEWVLLSGLKHFSKGLRTISIDRFYQPQASWSFPNMSLQDWHTNINMIISKLEGK